MEFLCSFLRRHVASPNVGCFLRLVKVVWLHCRLLENNINEYQLFSHVCYALFYECSELSTQRTMFGLHYCEVLRHTFKLYVQIKLYVVLLAQIQRTFSKFLPRNNLFPMLLFVRRLCTSLTLETV